MMTALFVLPGLAATAWFAYWKGFHDGLDMAFEFEKPRGPDP